MPDRYPERWSQGIDNQASTNTSNPTRIQRWCHQLAFTLEKNITTGGFNHVALNIQSKTILNSGILALQFKQHIIQTIEMLNARQGRIVGQSMLANQQLQGRLLGQRLGKKCAYHRGFGSTIDRVAPAPHATSQYQLENTRRMLIDLVQQLLAPRINAIETKRDAEAAGSLFQTLFMKSPKRNPS